MKVFATPSPHAPCVKQRRALDLLPQCADMSALAFDLGFSSHSHFASAFRQTYGRSPSAFRQSLA